ncbi:CHM1B protein, partial [Centropus unirufus]|nr:CHM1B protein [Centropus unirufus]
SSRKCDQEEKAEKAKVKRAMQKGDVEAARIHAENAIRQKNRAGCFLRLSTRLEAAAAWAQAAVAVGKAMKSMAAVMKAMDATLKSRNVEKISALVEKVEHQLEALGTQARETGEAMSSSTVRGTPQDQVDMLLREMADQAGLDLSMELPQGQTGAVGTSIASAEQDELSQRLAHLRDEV